MNGDARLAADLEAAATYGQDDAGVTRLAFSPALLAVHGWLEGRMREAGLDVEHDPAGNVVGRWQAGHERAVLIGSHLDTVPRGGRYDGALGVLAGLEAIRRLRDAAFQPVRPIWLISFMDEEGARFGAGMLGSTAFAGESLDGFEPLLDADGVSLPDAMRSAGLQFERLAEAAAVDRVGTYVELHIEQGPTLAQQGCDLGVVTAITGLLGMSARLRGQENHAGTTPMDARRDALLGAALFARDLARMARTSGQVRGTVGRLVLEPGASNVIPGSCTFSIDARAADPSRFRTLEPEIVRMLEDAATREHLDLQWETVERLEPAVFDAELVDELERVCNGLEGTPPVMRVTSGAVHDAQVMARHVPTAMLFVPSRDGVSHSPAEYTSPRHCELGARALAATLRRLAS